MSQNISLLNLYSAPKLCLSGITRSMYPSPSEKPSSWSHRASGLTDFSLSN